MKIDSIKLKILPTLKAAGVIRASIFGSVARGESGPASDIDLLVELPKGKSLFDLIALKLQLEEILGIKVDLATPGSLSSRVRPFIQKDLISVL